MKIFGRRRFQSTNQLSTTVDLAHTTFRHDNGKGLRFYGVPVPSLPPRKGRHTTAVPRMRLILVSESTHSHHRYERIEISFNAEETRRLEAALAQALGTRTVRKDARPLTRITRQQARKRQI